MSRDVLDKLSLQKLQERLNRRAHLLEQRGFPPLIANNVAIFIRAYLYKYENKYQGKEIKSSDIFFQSSIFPEESSNNKNKYRWLIGGKNISLHTIKKFLDERGVPILHVNDRSLELGFYEYVYKSGENLGRLIWFDKNSLFEPDLYYSISDANWESIVPYPITREELLKVNRGNSYMRTILTFQTLDTLKEIVNTIINSSEQQRINWENLISDLPPEKVFTKSFLIRYIPEVSQINVIEEICANTLDPTGRRRALVSNYINTQSDMSIFRASRVTLNSILSYPPFWFEEEYILGGLRDVSINRLIEMEIVNPEYDNTPSPLYITDENNHHRLPTHVEIGEMILRRDPLLKYFSKDVILRSVGYSGISEYVSDDSTNNLRLIFKIKVDIEDVDPKFRIYTKFDMCDHEPNRPPTDLIFMNELEHYVVTYGTYMKARCMSLTDLLQAFEVDNEGLVIFRSPFDMTVFRLADVKQLQSLLINQPDNFAPGFREERDELVKIISSAQQKFSLKISDRIIKQYMEKSAAGDEEATKALDLLSKMMVHLFRAGMYQRTWKGINPETNEPYPYPHKRSEADIDCKVSQRTIDITMTPELISFMELYNSLPDEFRKYFDSFPLIYKIENSLVTQYNESIIITVEQIIGTRDFSGNYVSGQPTMGAFCVGSASAYLIYTAYYYLGIMGKKIEGFDISIFDDRSGHRL